jgi:phosphoribosyl 1,2-cyclic phosphodiesterase
MKVTFHGVRGSVPTPGAGTVRYGGNTSCVEVRLADGTLVILDAGTGLRPLGKRLVEESMRGPIHLFITHLHWDHVLGLPFFAPIYEKDTTVVLHPLGIETAEHMLAYDELFDGRRFPLKLHQLPCRFERPRPVPGPVRIGSATVTRTLLNHPGGSTGFRIDDDGGSSLVLLTDNELDPPYTQLVSLDALARFSADANLLIHDAQYLGDDMPHKRGWGHSTVKQVLELGGLANVRKLALYHHDPDRDDAALDAIGQHASTWWRANARSGEVIVAAENLSLDF